MDDHELTKLGSLVGKRDKLIFEAVKAGTIAELPHESQLYAHAIQEHMHLKHVHNALEFGDVRDGAEYQITVDGETVSPMAHVVSHAAVKGQLEQDFLVRAAFEKMVATGTSAHHAEHVLAALLVESHWVTAMAVKVGKDIERGQKIYIRKLQRLRGDSAFRKKLVRQFKADHSAFE